MPGPARIPCLVALFIPLLAPTLWAEPASRPATPPTTRPFWSAIGLNPRIQRRTYQFKDGDAPAVEMEYGLFLPKNYDKSKKTPLVLLLHGLYSNPQQILRYPGMTEQADKYGYILVAPMGYNNHGWYGAVPMVRGSAEDPKNLPELSEKDAMNVLEIARKEFNVDPDRIYLAGHSMGGGGTWHLGIKHPDLWAALAPIAPATTRPATDAEKIKNLPVILVQGDQDPLVKVDRVRPWAEEMKKLKMDYQYIEVPGGNHISVAFNALPQIFDFFEQHKRGQMDGEAK